MALSMDVCAEESNLLNQYKNFSCESVVDCVHKTHFMFNKPIHNANTYIQNPHVHHTPLTNTNTIHTCTLHTYSTHTYTTHNAQYIIDNTHMYISRQNGPDNLQKR